MSVWRWNVGRQRWEREHAHITHDRAKDNYTWTVAGFSKTVRFFGLGRAKKEADRAVSRYLWIDDAPMMPDSARFGRSGVDRLALHDVLRSAHMWDEASGVNRCNPVALHAAIDTLRQSKFMTDKLGALLADCARYDIAIPDDRGRWVVPQVGARFVSGPEIAQSCEARSSRRQALGRVSGGEKESRGEGVKR